MTDVKKDQKEGGISEKKMEKTVRNVLLVMLGIVIITLVSLRIYEEVLKNEQQKPATEERGELEKLEKCEKLASRQFPSFSSFS